MAEMPRFKKTPDKPYSLRHSSRAKYTDEEGSTEEARMFLCFFDAVKHFERH